MTPTGHALDVLVVEDNPALRDVLRLHLGAEGWGVRCTGDGSEALALCAERRPDIVVLDVMLPGRSGFEVCAALRATYDPSPGVVMVTARSGELDVILGLEVGADDYVIKPCRPREIVARVRALSRRVRPSLPPAPPAGPPGPVPSPSPEEGVLVRGSLRISPETRRVSVAGAPVRVTPMEFELLRFLAQAPERVYTRGQLLQALWDSAHEGYERSVDCHVTRLRRKLEAAGLLPTPIETVHGVGYRFTSGV